MSRELGIPLTLYETVAYTAMSVGRITERGWQGEGTLAAIV
jgi:hypothetical protein